MDELARPMSGALPLAREAAHGLALVAFDCDGVLVDAHSSWRVLHQHFGTDNGDMLHRFIAGEVSDAEFMRDDIRMWKEAHPGLTRDHLFRAYAGLCLIPGARDTIRTLQLLGVEVAIVSAGVLVGGSGTDVLGRGAERHVVASTAQGRVLTWWSMPSSHRYWSSTPGTRRPSTASTCRSQLARSARRRHGASAARHPLALHDDDDLLLDEGVRRVARGCVARGRA